MTDCQDDERQAAMIARWICIAYWTVIVAPVAALLMLLPIGLILFLIAPGWAFNEWPAMLMQRATG